VRYTRAALVSGVMLLSACTPTEVVQLIFGDDAPAALRVADCESSMNPRAVSPGGGNHGLFQINSVHAANFEVVTGKDWYEYRYDAIANAEYARWLQNHEGWRPWSCRP
jgi:hypothetical protein